MLCYKCIATVDFCYVNVLTNFKIPFCIIALCTPCSIWSIGFSLASHLRKPEYPWTAFPTVLMDFPGGSDGKASVYNVGDPGSIPGSGRSPGEGNGSPLQYSCLENPMDGGAWWAIVHGVATEQLHHRGSDKLDLIILVLAVIIWNLVSSWAWTDKPSFDNVPKHFCIVDIHLHIVITEALWASSLYNLVSTKL